MLYLSFEIFVIVGAQASTRKRDIGLALEFSKVPQLPTLSHLQPDSLFLRDCPLTPRISSRMHRRYTLCFFLRDCHWTCLQLSVVSTKRRWSVDPLFALIFVPNWLLKNDGDVPDHMNLLTADEATSRVSHSTKLSNITLILARQFWKV